MIEETYLKEYHDEGDTIVISFEGNREDIYCLRNYAESLNKRQTSCEYDYGKADYEAVVKPVAEIKVEFDNLQKAIDKLTINPYRELCEDEDIPYEEPSDMVDKPSHYRSGNLETIKKIEHVVDGLPSQAAYLLGNIIKYTDRAGLKDDAVQDLDKANNYAHRLVYGKWRHEH